MRSPLILAPLLVLAACAAPQPPAAGPGFAGFGALAPVPGQITAAPIGAPLTALAPQPDATAAPVPAAPSVAPVAGAGTMPGLAPTPLPAPPVAAAPAAISDEQDFDAVAARETIESDAARIEANRQVYQQIAPQPLPPRSGSAPNIVAYALSVTNRVGQPVWRRSTLALSNHDRACAAYASPDLAQQDFLARGGPQRDPRNLDPDGDGFACRWDPTPFQRARTGG